jgi:hypothetical protein
LILKIASTETKERVIYAIVRILRGAEEDRTPDPLLAKQVLSQLSYSPIYLLEHRAQPTAFPLSYAPKYYRIH